MKDDEGGGFKRMMKMTKGTMLLAMAAAMVAAATGIVYMATRRPDAKANAEASSPARRHFPRTKRLARGSRPRPTPRKKVADRTPSQPMKTSPDETLTMTARIDAMTQEEIQRMFMSESGLDLLEECLDVLSSSEDWGRTKRLMDAMTSIPDWRTRAIEDAQDAMLSALSEFGSKSIPELMEFIYSSFPDVREDAMDELAESLEGSEDDLFASRLIVQLSGSISDADFAERMMDHLDMMDNSSAAGEAMLGVYVHGNETFRHALKEAFPDIDFSSRGSAEEGVRKWMNEQNDDDVSSD